MIGERQKALLQAAATIFAGVVSSPNYVPDNELELARTCVDNATNLLSLIEAREKASYGSKPIVLPDPRPCTCEDVPGDHARCPIHGES